MVQNLAVRAGESELLQVRWFQPLSIHGLRSGGQHRVKRFEVDAIASDAVLDNAERLRGNAGRAEETLC